MGTAFPRKLTPEEQERLDLGKPIILGNGIRINKNKETGEFEGIP